MRAGWTDHHPHTETNVVLDGRLHVESKGVTVVAGPGDTVQVPAGPCRPLLGTRVRADARRLRTGTQLQKSPTSPTTVAWPVIFGRQQGMFGSRGLDDPAARASTRDD